MIISRFRIFKLSVLVTPYDKHLNPELYQRLSNHSETITSSKYAARSIVSEEWQNFYSHANCEINAYLSNQLMQIVMTADRKEVHILNLCLTAIPNVRCQTKDKTLQIKYYIEWIKKYQLTFYAENEMIGFKRVLECTLTRLYGNMRLFVDNMDELSGDVNDPVLDGSTQTKKSCESLKQEFSTLVNKDNKD